jgi:hypothetical protein
MFSVFGKMNLFRGDVVVEPHVARIDPAQCAD